MIVVGDNKIRLSMCYQMKDSRLSDENHDH